jgi:hypothetical protein
MSQCRASVVIEMHAVRRRLRCSRQLFKRQPPIARSARKSPNRRQPWGRFQAGPAPFGDGPDILKRPRRWAQGPRDPSRVVRRSTRQRLRPLCRRRRRQAAAPGPRRRVADAMAFRWAGCRASTAVRSAAAVSRRGWPSLRHRPREPGARPNRASMRTCVRARRRPAAPSETRSRTPGDRGRAELGMWCTGRTDD